jgi:RNA polymerase sigma-70 factor (ECF subfamily)
MPESDSPSTSHSLLELLASPYNGSAWADFVKRYDPFLRKRCRAAGLRDHDADEVTARVLKKLVVAFQRFCCDPSLRFRGYLTTVVRNEVRKYWAEERRSHGQRWPGCPSTHRPLEEIPAPLQEMAADLDESMHQDLAFLQSLLNEVQQLVKETTWQAFWLTTFAGRSPKEVARELGLSATTVSVYKGRVLQMLLKRARKVCPELAQRQGEET